MKVAGMLSIVGVSVLTGCTGTAEGPTPETTTPTRGAPDSRSSAAQTAPSIDERVSPTDTRILSIMNAKNLEYARLGQLAAARGASDDVRQFGETLAQYHTACNAMVQQAAETARVTMLQPRDIRDVLARESGETMPFDVARELGSMTGAGFDQTFARRMLEGHREFIRLVERSRPDAESMAVRSLVDRTLPTLRDHLRAAVALAGR